MRNTLFRSFFKFYCSLRDCAKYEVRHLFQLQKYDVWSIFGKNRRNIRTEMGARDFDSIDIMNMQNPFPTTPNEACRLPFMRELCLIRDGYGHSILTKQEVEFLLEFLCTT